MIIIKNIIAFLIFFLLSLNTYAQSPEKFNYQMLVRDVANNVIANQLVAVQISILKTSSTGTVVFAETHSPTTSESGVVSFVIGEGIAAIGAMNTINWSSGDFYIKTELDVDNNGTYDISGASQFLSVPYALHANNLVDKTYVVNTYYPELGGYVIEVTPNGKHGIVVAMQDQATSSNWYDAQGFIDNPSNHDADGMKFRDWRLPTFRELSIIYFYRVELNTTLGTYWTDSQANMSYSQSLNFINEVRIDSDKTTTNSYVRAIRVF